MTLAAMARNINMITAYLDIDLVTIHIEGKLNVIADTLSRSMLNVKLSDCRFQSPFDTIIPQGSS